MLIGHHKENRKLVFQPLALDRCSDKGLTVEMSASKSFYSGQFTLSTQLIKPNYLDPIALHTKVWLTSTLTLKTQ